MVNYANGKVYRIVCNVTGLQYVGSTTQPLHKRHHEHKRHFKMWTEGKFPFVSSFKVLENDNYDICLLEEVSCESKDQLHRAERAWIEQLECVNRCVPTRTHQEWYQANKEDISKRDKQYYKVNKEAISEKKKQYYKANKEAISAKNKQYYKVNKEAISEKNKQYYKVNKEQIKQYYESHKDSIKARAAERIQCPCGSEHSKGDKAKHLRTAKHQAYINQSLQQV